MQENTKNPGYILALTITSKRQSSKLHLFHKSNQLNIQNVKNRTQKTKPFKESFHLSIESLDFSHQPNRENIKSIQVKKSIFLIQ